MDKAFFEHLEDHQRDYAQRKALSGAGAELVLVNTKVYGITKVVEASETWLHVDAEDVSDDHKQVSLVLPYHQISHVRFREPRPRPGQAGFGR